MHIAAIYFIQRQIAAQNRYNKRSYKKQVFTWRTISFLHKHLLFYLLFTAGINSGSQVFITDPTINPTVIYNNPVRHIAAIAAFPYVPYKIGKLQIQGFSEPTTPNKIKQSYHITQKAARSRPRAAFLRGKLGRRQDFSKK